MLLVIVLEKPCNLAAAAQCGKELNALVPRNCSVLVVVHNEYRGLHIRYKEQWRVLVVEVITAPEIFANTALSLLILYLTGNSAAPADTAVCTGHI